MFGKLITLDGSGGAGKFKLVDAAGGDSLDGDHDLKEHMVGILFSRSKLSHLQRQVGHQDFCFLMQGSYHKYI